MISRLYVHNFRCLENFEFLVGKNSSSLLIGKNGTGKSTVSEMLSIFQSIARGVNRVGQLVKPKDFSRGRSDVPMVFDLEAELKGKVYIYNLAFDYPSGFKELRVLREKLTIDGQVLFSRSLAEVALPGRKESGATFRVDWHMIALPIIQGISEEDPLILFKQWLARWLILCPIPRLIGSESSGDTLEPHQHVQNFGEWFSGLVAYSPAAYMIIDRYLKGVFPDFWDVKNGLIGGDSRSLKVQFRVDNGSIVLPFAELSDGEKCFFICALVLASNEAYGPIFCFWDEPDNYLSIAEVGYFVAALRRSFSSGGQLLMASHNREAIRCFSDENTFLLSRQNHLEPTQLRAVDQLGSDFIDEFLRGEA